MVIWGYWCGFVFLGWVLLLVLLSCLGLVCFWIGVLAVGLVCLFGCRFVTFCLELPIFCWFCWLRFVVVFYICDYCLLVLIGVFVGFLNLWFGLYFCCLVLCFDGFRLIVLLGGFGVVVLMFGFRCLLGLCCCYFGCLCVVLV